MAKTIYHESNGQAIQLTLSHTVLPDTVAVVDSWLGIAVEGGDSGDTTALWVDDREYQFYIPDSLSVAIGDTVYIEIADLTGHTPDDTAYSTTAGAGKLALCKATSAKVTANGTGDHYCMGKSLLHGQGI